MRLASQAALNEKHKRVLEADETPEVEALCVTSHHFEIALTQVSPSVSHMVSNKYTTNHLHNVF